MWFVGRHCLKLCKTLNSTSNAILTTLPNMFVVSSSFYNLCIKSMDVPYAAINRKIWNDFREFCN